MTNFVLRPHKKKKWYPVNKHIDATHVDASWKMPIDPDIDFDKLGKTHVVIEWHTDKLVIRVMLPKKPPKGFKRISDSWYQWEKTGDFDSRKQECVKFFNNYAHKVPLALKAPWEIAVECMCNRTKSCIQKT